MPKPPTQVIFTCQSCRRASVADARKGNHLLPFLRKLPIRASGECIRCGSASWTISVIFAETSTDVAQSTFGLAIAAVTGQGFVQQSTHVNQMDYTDVPAEIVALLNEYPRERLNRVGQFVWAKEREYLKQHGGRECLSCAALFVPTPGKPWSEQGYCSKMCHVDAVGADAAGPAADVAFSGKPQPALARIIKVQCVKGHPFEVQTSFAGTIRPCPVCGTKTQVQTSQVY
jgi:hypothetical protein